MIAKLNGIFLKLQNIHWGRYQNKKKRRQISSEKV